ncbi:MAG: AraC family transcriptional regulator [Coriobacteriia bacterium]|nr:AraC family transcriptional regulator [Coriobacteriia bacterium]MCL2749995.1 AraC family transcriptional regulator [Coriobacteriia bacterium]
MINEAYTLDQSALKKGAELLTHLLNCVTQGKVDDIEERFSKPDYSELAELTIGNDLILARATLEFILPQLVRAAINGGLSWSISNDIYFSYKKELVRAVSVQRVLELHDQIFMEFAKKTAQLREDYGFSPLVRKCRVYVSEHIYAPITVCEIAQAHSVSPSYLSRTYKKETSESISDYIRRKKITEAQWLLTHTSLTLTQVYIKLGYCSQSYFTEVFRKETGMTPRFYRTLGRS